MTGWDAEGRPAEWVTTTEPEWDAEDRAIIFALLDLKADICDGCGELLSESLHVDGRPDPQYSNHFAVCMGCVAKQRGMAELDKRDAPTEKQGGMVFRMARKWVLRRR